MQNFWKSVKSWQSYGEFKGGDFLRHSVETLHTGLRDDEDRIPLRSLVLTQYRSHECDGQTDGAADLA